MGWISIQNTENLPKKQVDVAFYAEPFVVWYGIFTPKGMFGNKEALFQYYEHWGDDCYHTIEGVTHYMVLPPPEVTS